MWQGLAKWVPTHFSPLAYGRRSQRTLKNTPHFCRVFFKIYASSSKSFTPRAFLISMATFGGTTS